MPIGAAELTEGHHDVVIFVALREPPPSVVHRTSSTVVLVEQFKSEKVFWRQFPIAKEIIDRNDASVLPSLVDWLSHEDRHIRGNVAFVFGGFISVASTTSMFHSVCGCRVRFGCVWEFAAAPGPSVTRASH